MSKTEPIISDLADRDSRINKVIAAFRTLQSQYKICLYIDNLLKLVVTRIVAVFYYIFSSIFSRRLRVITKSIKLAHI